MRLSSPLLTLLLVALALPLGQPSLRVSFEVLYHLFDVFGQPHPFLLLYPLLGIVSSIYLDFVLDLLFLFDRNVYILFNELEVSDVSQFLRALNTPKHLFSLADFALIKVDSGYLDLDM